MCTHTRTKHLGIYSQWKKDYNTYVSINFKTQSVAHRISWCLVIFEDKFSYSY